MPPTQMSNLKAQMDSRKAPGWAMQTTNRLWVLGRLENLDGYRLHTILDFYSRIKPQLPRDNEPGNALGRQLLIHPTLAGHLMRVRTIRNAARWESGYLHSSAGMIRADIELCGDPCLLLIGENFGKTAQNSFYAVRLGGPQPINRYFPLPVPNGAASS